MSEERVMVLTGASSGLGAEVAAHFAANGFGIAMNYVVEEDRMRARSDDSDDSAWCLQIIVWG